jgi:hypothetical protein
VLEARIDECGGAIAIGGKSLVGLRSGNPDLIDTSLFEGGDKDKISAQAIKMRRDALQAQLTKLEKEQTDAR